ncbi:glycoside hydrolase family 28 protein [Lentinula aciculospora]|uniref:Glycoside hydrolase family 28 protein n=1 Tax=Lentinula aciculospora TaxID=153920 RepID=A0A9W9A7J5_9AGAR|nr:glycoside hydrolase family 28 protein [Lentinula aciculospora]KAJ4488564.1 glycoside hydrolase family 28 protein [Lentinula aciculospora]
MAVKLSVVLTCLCAALPSLTLGATLEKRATCTPTSHGESGVDDVPSIAAAIQSCGNGGIILIPAGVVFQIGSTLSFAGCNNCEMQIEGTLKLTNNLYAWDGVKAVVLLDDITGATIHSVTGTGLLDGNGVPYWTEFNEDSSYSRPTLVYIEGGSDIAIENLLVRNAPNVFMSAAGGATNIQYSGLTMQAIPSDGVTPKNTDGFDIGPASQVTITNDIVDNQDDCVAFKGGANFVTVTDISCSGSHGLSIGSLGEGTSDNAVTNIFVSGATMTASSKATGIKLWDGSSGHGVATVSNVTFNDITVDSSDYAAQIQVCYESTGTCVPSAHQLTDVVFSNFKGTTSGAEGSVVANLDCPADGTCGIVFENFAVNPPSGSAEVLCSNVPSSADISCNGAASG